MVSAKIHYLIMELLEVVFSFLTFAFHLMLPVSKFVVTKAFDNLGVKINGNRSYDIQVKNDRFYSMVIARGLTGFGKAYVERYIECEEIELLFEKMCAFNMFSFAYFHPYRLCNYLVHRYFDIMDIENASNQIKGHYDGEEGVSEIIPMLSDENVQYSVMMLDDLKAVEEASIAELKNMMNEGAEKIRDLYARKLKLEPGMTVLDIGCGFGGLAKHLAERYHVHVTGVTLSKGMYEYAKNACKRLDVEIKKMDYRLVNGKFDRIVSIQMFEHVGENHHREYFEKVNSLLKDDGLFLFQCHHLCHKYTASYEPMLDKIFQLYCYFPKVEEVCLASKGLFIIEDMQSHSYRTGITSKAFFRNIKHYWHELEQKTGEKNLRKLYIYGCTAYGAGLNAQDRVYDYVFSKNGLRLVYTY